MAKKLSPAMERMVRALEAHGYVDTIRDGGTVNTVVALMDRGILREATPRWHPLGPGRHYPATERTDQLHLAAWVDHLEWSREHGALKGLAPETWDWFIARMRKEWGIPATAAQRIGMA